MSKAALSFRLRSPLLMNGPSSHPPPRSVLGREVVIGGTNPFCRYRFAW
jgi:hypothetical protein